MKIEDFEVRLFALGMCSLAFKVSLHHGVLYITRHSLVLAIFRVFEDFVPIPMYRDNKTICSIPT